MGWQSRPMNRGSGRWGGFPPYMSVEERREEATKEIAALRKRGRKIAPVQIEGRAIATTFWGKAWCQNLERYSDHESRLPRGRSYVRCGAKRRRASAKSGAGASVAGEGRLRGVGR